MKLKGCGDRISRTFGEASVAGTQGAKGKIVDHEEGWGKKSHSGLRVHFQFLFIYIHIPS